MKSIISPFFIFCLGTLNRLKKWCMLALVISGLILIPTSLTVYYLKVIEAEKPTFTLRETIPIDKTGNFGEKTVELYEDDKEELHFLPLVTYTMQIAGLVFVITTILQVGIPSRETLIAMRVTKFITIDNIAKAIEKGGHFKEVVKEDIIEIIEAMKPQVTVVKIKKKRKK